MSLAAVIIVSMLAPASFLEEWRNEEGSSCGDGAVLMLTFDQFYEQFQQEVTERAASRFDESMQAEQPAKLRETSFTEVMLEYLDERGVVDDASVCDHEVKTTKGFIRLSAWASDVEEGNVTLCVSLYQGLAVPQRLHQIEVTQAFDQAARAFEQAVSGFHEFLEPASEAHIMMRHLYEMRAEVAVVQVVLLTDSLLPKEPPKRRDRKGAYTFKFDCWDLQRLHRVVASDLPYESVVIDLQQRFAATIPCLPVKSSAGDHSVFLGVIPGQFLAELYDEFGTQLLDLNVRSFLQAKGKVNKGIRDTLCKEPARFLAYNNGICATAEQVDVGLDGDGTPFIRSLTGFQIVNGGQTVASIHRATKIDKIDVSTVSVMAKITQVPSCKVEELAPLISRYANSQNKVSEADFTSNDPFHIELQRLSEKTWVHGEQSLWFYERTRGQYQVQRFREGGTPGKLKQFEAKCPAAQKFNKTDAAKFLNCWERRPDVVSRGAQKNFVAFMDDLRTKMPKEWRPDDIYYRELVAKAIIFRSADKVAREAGIGSYKANVVAYLVALLSEKSSGRLDLLQVWKEQACPEPVLEAFHHWVMPLHKTIVESAAGRNVTEWCKREACWKAVCGEEFTVPSALAEEFGRHQPLPNVGKGRSAKKEKLSPKEQDSIVRTMRVDASGWFKLSEWGRRTRKLKDWQCDIAITLSGYAQGGWEKIPSTKQAHQAVRMLEMAEEGGFGRIA